MMRRLGMFPQAVFLGLFLLCLMAAIDPDLLAEGKESPASERMPLTTKSEKARSLFESGILKKGNYRLNECLADLRHAVKQDPKFAAAWALLGHFTDNSAETADALTKARWLAPQTSASEQIFIRWLSSIHTNEVLAAISSANDLLALHPRDKYVVFLGADWFSEQGSLSHAVEFFERVIQIDPQFTAAYNRLGYAYADLENFPRALEVMQRYVALLPKDPNPQDSFADVSMKAGKLDDAITHFRAALALDPKFAASLHGLGDTYMLMGDYPHAREQDAKAIANAANRRREAWYRSSIAQTWVREKNYAKADEEFAAIVEMAHSNDLHDVEASLRIQMSLYKRDPEAALSELGKAEESLAHAKDLTALERDETLSGALRWRAVRAMEAGNAALAKECIQKLQASSDSTGNDLISANYHAALGALLLSEKKYKEAIPHLEEDRRNPYSLQMLIHAYRESGNKKSADAAKTRLLQISLPTMEQALVVVPAQEKEKRAGTR